MDWIDPDFICVFPHGCIDVSAEALAALLQLACSLVCKVFAVLCSQLFIDIQLRKLNWLKTEFCGGDFWRKVRWIIRLALLAEYVYCSAEILEYYALGLDYCRNPGEC